MNWFKKQINKLFAVDEEVVEQPQQPQSVTPPQPQPRPQKQRDFTFPLIPDEQQTVQPTVEENATVDVDIYEIEQPKISEILAERSTKKKVYRMKRAPLSTEPTIRDVINAKRATDLPKAPTVKPQSPVVIQPKEATTPIKSTRKTPFKATDVPSPVHGFMKPSGLSKKLEEARQQSKQSPQPKPVRKLHVVAPVAKEGIRDTSSVVTQDLTHTATKSPEVKVEKTSNQLGKVAPIVEVQTVVTKPPQAVVDGARDSLTRGALENRAVQSEATDVVEASVPALENETVQPEATDAVETVTPALESEMVQSEATDVVEASAPALENEMVQSEATDAVETVAPALESEMVQSEATDVVEASASALENEAVESEATDVVEASVPALENETVQSEATEAIVETAQQIPTEHATVQEEKVLPFNVIMLNSDKQKLAQKKSPQLAKGEEVQPQPAKRQYVKPAGSLLIAPEENLEDYAWMDAQSEQLVEALSHFQVEAEVVDIVQGPAVTRFEITIGQGTKVNKIRNLSDDLKLALAAKDIRIEAPIPGKSSIGIEIPNRVSRPVRLAEVIQSESFEAANSPMQAALGLDLTGQPISVDLRKMPHGLIAGATGSGKSVCINSLLVSLLYKAAPDELRLLLIDPKYVELASYNDIPHLVTPVITDPKIATNALKWAVSEMENRYKLLSAAKVRSIEKYNQLVEAHDNIQNKMPYMLIVIDELADLMQTTANEVEEAINRLAQKARACGIHIIVATQRPSVDVITGVIKANIPTRMAFSVSSQIDSRTILDEQGAERLLGRGDMLYRGSGMSAPIRLQGTFVTDEEIEAVVAHVKSQGRPHYLLEEEALATKNVDIAEQDELYEAACHFIYKTERASASALQRQFSIGYNRAARIIDRLEEQDLISKAVGSKPRDVYITQDYLDEMFG
ncbi:DNA translocase FtsK [Metalysinibacillus jejuensis]|uniref:DNA translocase FtsK n=1 Tax=Metalysinibacillus jejuensis TaxID=914327 RepID=UPI000D38B95C|nr:DNA translocase FtsK [Metalysinibacillus jejuensis]